MHFYSLAITPDWLMLKISNLKVMEVNYLCSLKISFNVIFMVFEILRMDLIFLINFGQVNKIMSD